MAKHSHTKSKPRLKDWFMSGLNPDQFDAEVDTSTFHSGTRCAHLYPNKSLKGDDSWATLMQQVSPHEYLDQRLRMSLWVKTKDVTGWVAPWMRVDGKDGAGDPLSFDNMCTRQIKDTTDWTRYDIVLEVPKESINIAFGVMIGGKGDAWIDDFTFEKVGSDIPVTDCPCSRNTKTNRGPANLNFEEDGDDQDPSSTLAELKSFSAEKEGEIKSKRSDTSTSILFKNETDKTITVYWLDFQGKRKRYGGIDPFGTYAQHTYETHAWLLADQSDRGLVIFVAEPWAGISTLQMDHIS